MRHVFFRLTALLYLFASPSAACAAGRLELVMFESASCEWCDLWRKEIEPVYAKSEEGRAASLRVVSIHVNKPADLQTIAGIVYTPTFVLWDGEREIGRILGYAGEIQFWGLLGNLLKKHREQAKIPAAPPPTDSRPLRASPVGKSR